MYITSSGDIRYNNRSYVVVIQRKSCARQQILAPSVASCVHVNNLSFMICVLLVALVSLSVFRGNFVLAKVN